MTYPSGQTNSGPPRRYGGGGGGGGGIPLSMEGAENWNTLWVDVTTSVYVADGSVQYPFNTITAALAAAALLAPTASNPVAIVVMPGVYDENVVLATDYVYLFGWDRDTTIITNVASPTLDVTTQYTGVRNLTVRTSHAVALAAFVRVRTLGADFTNAVGFRDCLFQRTSSTSVLISIEAGVRVRMDRCRLQTLPFVTALRALTLGARSYLDITDSQSDSGFLLNSGAVSDNYFTALRCDLAFMYPYQRAVCVLHDCTLRDDGTFPPVYVGGALPTSITIKGCHFVNALGAGNYDIGPAGLAITGAVIENNVMTRGISPNVSHVNPIKYVGSAGNKDFYINTREALQACTFDDCVVKLLKDDALAAAIDPPPAYKVTIDGNGKHTISVAGGGYWLYIRNGSNVEVRDLIMAQSVVGGHAAAATLRVKDCVGVNITLAGAGHAGALVEILDSTLVSDATYLRALTYVVDTLTPVVIKRSRMKGVAANPAIYWFNITNDSLKIEHSTITHGSGAANDPFGRNAAQVPNYRAHHTAFNAPQGAGWATNLIAPAQQFNTVDPATDF